MDYYFGAHQIAGLAMQIEEEGAKFYTQLAGKVREDKTKEIFTFLSAEELNHKATFSALADASKKDNPSFEYSVDLYKLMEFAVEGIKRSSLDLQSLADKEIDITKAMEIAIHLEKESIRIYTQIRSEFIERFTNILENILNEEKKHLKVLDEIKNKAQP